MTAPHGTFLYCDKNGRFVTSKEKFSNQKNFYIKQNIHKGILAFCKDFTSVFPNYVALTAKSYFSDAVYGEHKNKIFECNKKRYNRYRPGHPSGFIEAFANTYFDIFQNLQYYKTNKKKSIKDILNLSHAEKTLRLFEASFLSNKKKSWIEIKK